MFLVTPAVILHHEPNPQSADEAVCQDYDTARFCVILSPNFLPCENLKLNTVTNKDYAPNPFTISSAL